MARVLSAPNGRVLVMTILVSLGGMIFGYGGIGQIGGFLAMEDYRKRFGAMNPDVDTSMVPSFRLQIC
jgi:hypothetical protein